jgi:hypothetical protein
MRAVCRSTAVAVLAVAAALAGCGSDDEGQTVSVTETATVTQTATAPPPPEATVPDVQDPAPPTTPDDPEAGCRTADGNEVDVVGGDVDCAEAQAIAAAYDPQGNRVQEVQGWTCEGGNAMTRPVIFTCIQGDREFIVREGG